VLLAVLISASTVLVKAHYLLDIPGGVGLAFVSIRLAWWEAKEREKN
jgi:membrane-associated phospholipid phosphatase